MLELKWGDTLCGKVITPGDWPGGIVEAIKGGDWYAWNDDDALPLELKPEYRGWGNDIMDCEYPQDYQPVTADEAAAYHAYYRPVYPPRGWAGKSEAELWAAMVGEGVAVLSAGVWMHSADRIILDRRAYAGDELPALILALGNAQVLQRRLTEAQHG